MGLQESASRNLDYTTSRLAAHPQSSLERLIAVISMPQVHQPACGGADHPIRSSYEHARGCLLQSRLIA